MNEMKIYPEKITVEHIAIVQSQVSASDAFLNNIQKPHQIEIQQKQNSSFDIEQKKVRIRLKTLLEGTDDDKNELGVSGQFIIDFYIHVENFDDFIVIGKITEAEKQLTVNTGEEHNYKIDL